MTILENIPLQPTNLTRQRPTDVLSNGLEIRENCIRFYLEMYADETTTDDPVLKDDPEQWKQAYTNVDIIAKSENIAGIELGYGEDADVWKVTIMVWGFPGDIRMYFPTKEAAQPIFTKLVKYLFKFSPDQTTSDAESTTNG